MKRSNSITAVLLAAALAATGCAGRGSNPLAPSVDFSPGSTRGEPTHSAGTDTWLWGYYDIYIDIESQTATAVMNRHAMTTWNVLAFLNTKPGSLGFHILSTPVGPDYIDIDLDISITHPFDGMNQFDGYDVRGVFMGDASSTMKYNTDLHYAQLGVDQFMMDDPDAHPDDAGGGPDGYTRWFNRTEFIFPGVLGYAQPKVGAKNYEGNATLNPYKYFADGLGANDDAAEFLATTGGNGVFAAGSTNTRNYYIRFPYAMLLRCGYAILANWQGPAQHPANTPEAVACSVAVVPDLYYQSDDDWGGDLILDINLFGWVRQPSRIYVESTVLSGSYEFTDTEMIPIGGGDNYSTYHVEIEADNITHGTDDTWDNEFWVIAEYEPLDYTNSYGVPNLAYTDFLAAAFRYPVYVTPIGYNCPPVCVLEFAAPYAPWSPDPIPVEFDASGSYDPDGDLFSFAWDFDGDWEYGEDPDDAYIGSSDKPTHVYSDSYSGEAHLQVLDEKGGDNICSLDIDLAVGIPSKNIPLRAGVAAYDLAVDRNTGILRILYEDGQIWRYLEADYYQTGSFFIDTVPGADRIDISPDGSFIVAGNRAGTLEWAASYDPAGVLLATHDAPGGAIDVIGSVVEYIYPQKNQHCVVGGWYDPSYDLALFRYLGPTYDWGPVTVCQSQYGIGKLHHLAIRGCEAGAKGDYVCFVEADPEFRVEFYTFSLYYMDEYIGPARTDEKWGFWDPQDITRSKDNILFILDWLSTGEPRVKRFTEGYSQREPFGDATTISGDPLRIEGSDYDNNIFVLHSDGLSIFFPSDKPE